jgi:hypothetical protein
MLMNLFIIVKVKVAADFTGITRKKKDVGKKRYSKVVIIIVYVRYYYCRCKCIKYD